MIAGQDAYQEQADVRYNDSHVGKIEPPVLKKEAPDNDTGFTVASRCSCPAGMENVSTPSYPSIEKRQTRGLALPRTRSPLEEVKSGLILPTVNRPEPAMIQAVTQRKRKRTPWNEFDPNALANKASRIKRTPDTLKVQGSLEDDDGTGAALPAGKDDEIVHVERSDDEQA